MSKAATLSDAVAQHVRRGDALHLGATHVRGAASAWEVLKQFRGTDPGFELIGVSMTTAIAPLVHERLAKRIVSSWVGDTYYTPGPSPIYRKAHADGVEFKHWTMLTIPQRLAAAAKGLAWTTTRSMIGSDLEAGNAGDIVKIGEDLALIRALTPDVSFFHAPAADEDGNAILTPPLLENTWGALAARRGVIITTERIVDRAFIREHADLVKIPSHVVLAVCEVPFGAHPGGMWAPGLTSYGEDYPFWASMREALRVDPDAWIHDWILEPDDRAAYVKLVGEERLETLVKQADPHTVPEHVQRALSALDLESPANPIERAIVAGSRVLAERAEEGNLTHMLAGAGMANLAAWMAAADVNERGRAVDLVAEMGLVGYSPQHGEPFIFNQRNFPSCSMLADIETVMGVVMGGARAQSIASIGGAQVDKHGNVNSTMAGGTLLMGSGGANDVATTASECVITTFQRPDRLVDRVDYVTSPGARVVAMATSSGIYRKVEGELTLTAVFGEDVDAAAQEAVGSCGWDLRVARTLTRLDPPTPAELKTLRLLDPVGYFRNA